MTTGGCDLAAAGISAAEHEVVLDAIRKAWREIAPTVPLADV
jgi:hypothetical protein